MLRRRVDVRWRLTDEDFLRLPVQQGAMLRRAAELLKPGGTLVYSTCSLEREENEQVVEACLANCQRCAWSKPAARCLSPTPSTAPSPRSSCGRVKAGQK